MSQSKVIQILSDEYERCQEILYRLKNNPFACANFGKRDYWDGKVAGLKMAISVLGKITNN